MSGAPSTSRRRPTSPWRRSAGCAKEAGVTLTALSLAWTLQRPGITSIVLGPRTIDQLAGQLAALDVVIDNELLEAYRPDRAARRGHRSVLP